MMRFPHGEAFITYIGQRVEMNIFLWVPKNKATRHVTFIPTTLTLFVLVGKTVSYRNMTQLFDFLLNIILSINCY